jgi:hypothetical protein
MLKVPHPRHQVPFLMCLLLSELMNRLSSKRLSYTLGPPTVPLCCPIFLILFSTHLYPRSQILFTTIGCCIRKSQVFISRIDNLNTFLTSLGPFPISPRRFRRLRCYYLFSFSQSFISLTVFFHSLFNPLLLVSGEHGEACDSESYYKPPSCPFSLRGDSVTVRIDSCLQDVF